MSLRVEELLFAALEKPTEVERAAFLDSACGGDAELRRQVERMLRAQAKVGSFLEKPVVEQLAKEALGTVDSMHRPVPLKDAHDADAVGLPAVPGYRVLHELARGGMGRVLAGRDLALDRDVALKVLLPGSNVERFVRESKITARLPHPGIPPVHALGTLADGSPFLAMKLIAGQTLAELMKSADQPRLLQAFTQVCQAVGFAHSRGIVHRDLKPANVMVGEFGEVQVMDWGLAKDLSYRDDAAKPGASQGSTVTLAGADADQTTDHRWAAGSTDDQTRAGQVMGTPAYVAPEQARGEATDARADVFALGGMLCIILTGQPPFQGKSTLEVIQRARAAELGEAHARLDGCGADAELVALCRRCLSASPADRPADGRAVADALTAYLNGVQERLQAAQRERAAAMAREIERRKRRNVQFALAAAVVALLVGGGAFAFWRNEQAQAGRARDTRNHEAVATHLKQGGEALRAGDAASAQVALEAARKRSAEGVPEQQAQRLGRLDDDLTLLRELDRVDQFRWIWSENRFVDPAEVARRTRQALVRFGADPDATSVDEAAARMEASELRERIVSALDRLLRQEKTAGVRALLRRVDNDPYRDAVRDAVLANDGAKMAELSANVQTLKQRPRFAAFLGESEAIAAQRRRQLLQAAVNRQPENLDLLMALGRTFSTNHKDGADEALRWYQAAIAVAPTNYAAHINLGAVLCDVKRDYDGAIAWFGKAIEIDEMHPEAYTNLGNALTGKGQPAEALPWLYKALELDPEDAYAHNNLGNALAAMRRLDEAITCYNKAIALKSRYANAHFNLGSALAEKGRSGEAIACYNEAIALNPSHANAHAHLGQALLLRGKEGEAIACFKEALALDTNLPAARHHLARIHFNNGNGYQGSGKLDEAIASYREALEFDPKYAPALYGLGNVLQDKGRLNEAITCFRKCVEINPKHAEAHCNLGHALADQGQFAESLAALRRGHEVGSKQSGWGYPSAGWVREAEQRAAMVGKLDAFLKGEFKPSKTSERLGLAELCRRRKLHATEASLYADALAAEPRLASNLPAGHRYRAACAAAQAAAGQGEDAARLDDKERVRLRRQALDWLNADHTALGKLLDSGPPQARPFIVRALSLWQKEVDLVSLRDVAVLANLPADQQKAWTQLWANVVALQKKAESTAITPTGPVYEIGAGLELHGQLDGKTLALVYQVKLAADKRYVIDMVSPDQKALDPYLILSDATGKQLAEDDDSGGGLNARIVFRAERSGTYHIQATSFNQGTGAFTLTVREQPK
jgi:tetratricopeptide (TPR) repeat protein